MSGNTILQLSSSSISPQLSHVNFRISLSIFSRNKRKEGRRKEGKKEERKGRKKPAVILTDTILR